MTKNYSRKRRSKFRYFFFGAILIYLLLKFIPTVVSSVSKTDIVKYGNIQVTHQLDCYIVRDEKLVYSKGEGSIKYFIQEGEKVENGHKVAEIYKDTVDDVTRKKLEVINQRIESINANKDHLFQNDIEIIDKEIQQMIKDLRGYKEKGDLEKIDELVNKLNNKLEKKRIIVGDKSFSGKNLETLKQEQQQLQDTIDYAIRNIITPHSGIVSFNIDGYETILNPMNMATVKLEELKNMKQETTDLRKDKVIANQPLFKIVDNDKWYMVTWIDEGLIENYKIGRRVTIKFPQGEVQGKIYKIIKSDKGSTVIFQVEEYMEDFYSIRNIQVDVRVLNYEGLKIYNDSIIEKDGKEGVYVLDVNRYTNFKPIKIIGYDDEYAVIKSNVFYEKSGEDLKTVSTVKLYDEIVRNASKVKEGQLVY